VDLVGEESGGVNFYAFVDDKRPNGLYKWVLSLCALWNGSPKVLVEPYSVCFTFVIPPTTMKPILFKLDLT
jgi:hypothetical protein